MIYEKEIREVKLFFEFNGKDYIYFNKNGSKKNGTYTDSSHLGVPGQIQVEKYLNGKLLFDTIYSNRR